MTGEQVMSKSPEDAAKISKEEEKVSSVILVLLLYLSQVVVFAGKEDALRPTAIDPF